MPDRKIRPQGSTSNTPVMDEQTKVRTRVRPPGSTCSTRDTEILDRLEYLRTALRLAFSDYVEESVKRHTTDDFMQIFRMLLPGLLLALLVLISTIAVGAGIGAVLGAGAGAAVGAWIGAKVGLALLSYLGIAFLLVYIGQRIAEVSEHFVKGTKLAWDSCGDAGVLRQAAREYAEGVGTFASLLIQALLAYITSAAARGISRVAMGRLRGTRLFKSAAGLEAWLAQNYVRLCFRYKIRSGIQVLQGGATPVAAPRFRLLLGSAQTLLKGMLGNGDYPRFKSFKELHEFLTAQGYQVIEKGPKAADPKGVPFGTGRWGPKDAAGNVLQDGAQVIYANQERSILLKVKTRGYPDGKRASGTMSVEVTDGKGTGWPNALFKLDREGSVVAKALRGMDDVVVMTETSGTPGQDLDATYYVTRNGMNKLGKGATLSELSVERGELVSPFELLEGGRVKPMDQTMFNDRGHIDFMPGFNRDGVWKILGLE